MTAADSAAAREEQAELAALRREADSAAADTAAVLAELTGRLSDAARPRNAARRLAARTRTAAAAGLHQATAVPARHPALTAALTTAAAITAAALTYAAATRAGWPARNHRLGRGCG